MNVELIDYWLAGKTPKCVSRNVNASRTSCDLRPHYMGREDFFRKIRNRKQRTDIGKYFCVYMTIETGTNYLQKRSGLYLVNLKFLETELAKQL